MAQSEDLKEALRAAGKRAGRAASTKGAPPSKAGQLTMGFSETPPASPWGINFGGGLNSTAVIVECFNRGHRPEWILFADTGSEMPGTLDHVQRMAEWCAWHDWTPITVVRWERVRGDVIGFEPLHANCFRTSNLPSKAYGFAGCTSKWKVQPMDRWREKNGFQRGAFAVGYDADEARRITSACRRGDDPKFTAWYPLVAWGIGRDGCRSIVERAGLSVGKSSCWFCPNMKPREWLALKEEHPDLFESACRMEEEAAANGHHGRGGKGLRSWSGDASLREADLASRVADEANKDLDDRCHHGGCFT